MRNKSGWSAAEDCVCVCVYAYKGCNRESERELKIVYSVK